MTSSERFLSDALLRNARRIGDRAALVGGAVLADGAALGGAGGGVINWRQLAQIVDIVARQICDASGEHGRLIHPVSNTAADLIIALACQSARIVESPVDCDGGETYFESCRRQFGGWWIDDQSKADIVARAIESVFSDRDVGRHERPGGSDPASRECRADDDALVLWTSGTSGTPKGVVLSHRSLLSNAWAKLKAVPQKVDDHRHTVLSISHAYARTCDIGTWLLSGCSLSIGRGYKGWSGYVESESPQTRLPTHCNMVPSIAAKVFSSGPLPQTLRVLGCGGAAMSSEAFNDWSEIGVTVIQGYGLTEAGPVICSQTPSDSVPGRAGRFVEGWSHRIREGRLFVRGRHLMTRYLNAPEQTACRLDGDGWLDTGDLVATCPSTGQLQILGRADDRIVLPNGHKIDPAAIEQRLQSQSRVRTALIALDRDGHLVWWIESDCLADPASDVAAIANSLPRWEQPDRIERFSLDDSQRQRVTTRKGTVRRRELAEVLAARSDRGVAGKSKRS